MSLNIDQAAIDALKAKIEAKPPLDPEEMMRESLAGGAAKFNDNILYIGEYCCCYSIETCPTKDAVTLITHLSVSHPGGPQVTREVVHEIARAFGMGEPDSWLMEFQLPLGYNIIKIRG